eukprot:scaffold4681_cov72-Cyclotella_meneghiniana.AAC.10
MRSERVYNKFGLVCDDIATVGSQHLCKSMSFFAVDVILNLLVNIADGIVVWPNVVSKHVMEELPFMATDYKTDVLSRICDHVETLNSAFIQAKLADTSITLPSHQATKQMAIEDEIGGSGMCM